MPLIKGRRNKTNEIGRKEISIALVGNANVGKSVIFNQLTGLSQTIGNWPGKTVEKMEGHLNFLGFHFNIVDLPGIYSLSTYSLEEIVSREYIISDEVDLIINVIDATNLERNLFLTFQLLELKVPMILAVNQMDILRKRNMDIDFSTFQKMLKLPVLPVVAVHGIGVHQLLEEAIQMVIYKRAINFHDHEKTQDISRQFHDKSSFTQIEIENFTSNFRGAFPFPDLSKITSFGKEVEGKIKILKEKIENLGYALKDVRYPSRFLAIKLLENDEEIIKLLSNVVQSGEILNLAIEFREELEKFHGEDIHTIISSEIYNNINKIINKIIIYEAKKDIKGQTFADSLDHITTHSVWGYVILVFVIIGIYTFTFTIGDYLGGLMDGYYETLSEQINATYGTDNLLIKIFWEGAVGGFFGAVGGVLVYVVPFFLMIEILQDSGYLPRAAFLMDRFMHPLGVHGKTIIPMILGFGCNVPACEGCRIMETEREKKISIALTSLIPCAAVMTVVLGLVGRYLGLIWVLILLIINLTVVIIFGKILNKIMPGKCTELIMEMHEYRIPNYSVILKQTWMRTKEFIFKSMPLIIIIGILLEILLIFNALEPINFILSPVSVFWLGLPAITGVFLLYGILRKELTLVLLSILANSLGLSIIELLTPIQMIIFTLVTMLYIPCFATIIIIARQTNWKYAIKISLMEIAIALVIGGIIHFGALLIFKI
ncbi:MAG: ferrous iron transport protein B [Promethearchaeota archaeon]